jgi:hypothetical protein
MCHISLTDKAVETGEDLRAEEGGGEELVLGGNNDLAAGEEEGDVRTDYKFGHWGTLLSGWG